MYNEISTGFTFIINGQLYSIMKFRKIRGKLRFIVDEEAERIGVNHVNHYIRIAVKANGYNALAGCYRNQYAIALPKDALDMKDELLRYFIRHELRHCQSQSALPKIKICNKEFRPHDVVLQEPNCEIGFFIEDFDEIKCCDVLMRYYRHLRGIEHCLY